MNKKDAKKKNYLILIIITLLMLTIFGITMVKLKEKANHESKIDELKSE